MVIIFQTRLKSWVVLNLHLAMPEQFCFAYDILINPITKFLLAVIIIFK